MKEVTPYQNGDFDSSLFVEAGQFMTRNINNILFLFVISLSGMLKVFFWRYYSWAEYVAVAFYMLGVYTIFTVVNMFYITYVNPGFMYGAMLVKLVYFIWAMTRFIDGNKLWIALKSILAFVFALLLYIIMGYGLSISIVYLQS